MMGREKRFVLILVLLVIFALVLRLIFMLAFDNIYSHESESYSKIALVSAWIDAGMPYPDINFGPLHTWIIYGLTAPFENKVVPVRLFSLLCGFLVLIPYALTVRNLFDEKIALVSTALFAALPVHLRGSATSLALAPYILFMFTGIYFHFRYLTSRRAKFSWLILAALFINLAGALRFEAWLFLPLLCIFLIRKNFFHAVAFGAMNLAFPVLHMFMCFKQTGNPFQFAKTSSTSFLQYMPTMPLSYKLTGWFVSFGISMTVALAVLAALGLLYGAFTRRGFYFGALLLFNFGIFQYKTLTNTIDPSLTRYTTSMDLLLLPFAAMIIWAIANRIFRRGTRATTGAWVLSAFLVAQMIFFASWQAKAESFPQDVKDTVAFIKENAGPDDVILPDSRFHPYVMVESGLAYSQFVSLKFSQDRMNLDTEDLETLMATNPPTMVVLDYFLEGVDQVNSNLDAFKLPKSTKQTTSWGLVFTRLTIFGDFAVFKAEPVAALPPSEEGS